MYSFLKYDIAPICFLKAIPGAKFNMFSRKSYAAFILNNSFIPFSLPPYQSRCLLLTKETRASRRRQQTFFRRFLENCSRRRVLFSPSRQAPPRTPKANGINNGPITITYTQHSSLKLEAICLHFCGDEIRSARNGSRSGEHCVLATFLQERRHFLGTHT